MLAWDKVGWQTSRAVHVLKGCTALLQLTNLPDTEQREASQKMSERVNHTFWDAGKMVQLALLRVCETLQDTVMVVEAVDMCTGSVVSSIQ